MPLFLEGAHLSWHSSDFPQRDYCQGHLWSEHRPLRGCGDDKPGCQGALRRRVTRNPSALLTKSGTTPLQLSRLITPPLFGEPTGPGRRSCGVSHALQAQREEPGPQAQTARFCLGHACISHSSSSLCRWYVAVGSLESCSASRQDHLIISPGGPRRLGLTMRAPSLPGPASKSLFIPLS